MKQHTLKMNKAIEAYREEADTLRQWMLCNLTPSTPASEFCEVANRYAIVATRIYMVEKGMSSRVV